MKRLASVVVALILPTVCAFAAAPEAVPVTSPAGGSGASQNTTRFYCDRSALTSEQRQRHKELGKMLRAALIGIQEIGQGFEFEYPADLATYRAVTEYVPLERACCPFFEFGIHLEPEGGKLRVSLTGPAGVKAFIREEFSPLFER